MTGKGAVIFTSSANGHRIVLDILDRLGTDPEFLAFLRAQAR